MHIDELVADDMDETRFARVTTVFEKPDVFGGHGIARNKQFAFAPTPTWDILLRVFRVC